ncbi:hypothetical protein MAR_030451 [Mya arenaria]|uniref:Uncharacterized protein n=1 Tax=Mya arenaria TaxID=6604 RepID=A0ABY7F2L8_MYAAR|nr:uncharacterized protein LOC128205099 [Mya arenaria]WAR15857.1 hypothetical protein MAR_030451 [Mya arenaria]
MDRCDEYVEYYKHLMLILRLKQKELLKDYVCQDTIMMLAIVGVVIGGVLGGPGGAVVGAIIGYIYGRYVHYSYSELQKKIRNQTNSKKKELVHAVQALVGSNSKEELDLYVEAKSQQKQLMDCIITFT